MRNFAKDRTYLWLLRYMKGGRPASIARDAGVTRQAVVDALRRLGVGTRRWNERYLDAVIPPSARKAYSTQMSTAAIRGIEWEFTVEAWWAVWRESGKWSERGKSGYVMARTGDVGPYAPSNVRIATTGDNLREAAQNRVEGLELLGRIRRGECRIVPVAA